MMPRTRTGIDLLENSGARTNSGEIRASTRKKPTTLLLAELGDELLERHLRQPMRVGIDVHRSRV